MVKQANHRRAHGISVRERAYRYIKERISAGKLVAGSPVSELLLAKELGSSRTPIREAMKQLDAEGLLEQNPGGGMTVAQLKREDIVELYELREALEVYSAGKIARQPVRPADRDRLRLLVDQMLVLKKELEESEAQSLGKEQNQRFIDCDLGFHALLMSLTNNARMQRMVNDTRLLIRIFAIRRSGHTAAQLEGIHESHRRILDAVVEQSPLQAMQAMAEHIQVSQQERLNEYDSWRRETALRQHLPGIFEPKTQAGRP